MSIGISQAEMVKDDYRPLDATESTGLQSSVNYGSHPIIFSRASGFLIKIRGTYEGGNKTFVRKRGHREDEGATTS